MFVSSWMLAAGAALACAPATLNQNTGDQVAGPAIGSEPAIITIERVSNSLCVHCAMT